MLKNKSRQQKCVCSKNSTLRIVDIREFEAGTAGTDVASAHEIMFVAEGEIHIRAGGDYFGRRLQKGEFIYLPMGVELAYRTCARRSTLLFLRLVGNLPECHNFRINKTLKTHEEGQPEQIFALRANGRVAQFVEHLTQVIGDGMTCENYLRIKVSEMFYLLHAYYTEAECMAFFSSITSPDMDFSEFVRLNFLKFNTVDDLAAARGMTKAQFSAKFRRIYRTSPLEWLQQKRARAIYHDLCQSHRSIKEIAIDHHFLEPANFTHYCRKTFGKTPREIRESLDPSLRD